MNRHKNSKKIFVKAQKSPESIVEGKKFRPKREKVGQVIVEGVNCHENLEKYFVKAQKIQEGIVEGKKIFVQNVKKLANK